MHAERWSTQHLAITIVVALVFGAVGAAIFGLQLRLDRIRRHSIDGCDHKLVARLALPWKVVHLVLGLLLALTIIVMASALVAMIGRLGQGFTIFG